jgi:hypothetical protein
VEKFEKDSSASSLHFVSLEARFTTLKSRFARSLLCFGIAQFLFLNPRIHFSRPKLFLIKSGFYLFAGIWDFYSN